MYETYLFVRIFINISICKLILTESISKMPERILRVTMRYDNLYMYDTHVECQSLSNVEQIGPFGADMSKKNCTLVGGYSNALLKEILLMLNFKLELVTDVWAYDFENATKNGIDLFVNLYVLRRERAALVHPTFPTSISRLDAFLNHGYESTTRDILFYPVGAEVLTALFIITTISLISLMIIDRIRSRTISNRSNGGLSMYDIVFEGIAAVLQRGTLKLYSESSSQRLILCSISLCFLFTLSCYSASITALLSVPIYEITSVEALADSNYQIMLDKGYNNDSSSQAVMEKLSPNDEVLQKLLKKASKSKIKFDTFEKMIYNIRDGPVALITEDETALGAVQNTIGSLPCTWGQLPVRFIKYQCCMFMRKNFQYRFEINSLLLKMSQTGILKYHYKKWVTSGRKTCSNTKNEQVLPAELTNLYAAFILLTIGMFLSVLIIILEILIKVKPYFVYSL